MSLCDSQSLLQAIRKNVVYQAISKSTRQIPKQVYEDWKYFLLNYYFRLLHMLAEHGNFKFQTTNISNAHNLHPSLSQRELESVIQEKNSLIGIYEEPEWYTEHTKSPFAQKEHKNFLFLSYNPKSVHGKKATVSYHKNKTLEDVKLAELDYNQPITLKMIVGILLGTVLLLSEWTDVLNFEILEFQIVSILLLIVSLALMYGDVKNLILSIKNENIGAIVTAHKKSMRSRLDSSSAVAELEYAARRQHATIAKHILHYLIEKSIPYGNLSVITMHLGSQLNGTLEFKQVKYVIDYLLRSEIIWKDEAGHLNLNIEVDLIRNTKVMDERLLEEFDLPQELQDFIFQTYKYYLKIVNDLNKIYDLPLVEETICS